MKTMRAGPSKKNYPLVAGQRDLPPAERRIVGLNAAGRHSYLWIGNDGADSMACFGTLSGVTTLRKLAKAILEEVGE